VENICHFRLLVSVEGKIRVSFFHCFALLFFIKTVKRAFELSEPLGDEVKIYDCGFYGRVPEEPFDGVNISPLVQQVGCKAVTQRMDAGAFVYAGFFLALKYIM